MRGLSEMSSVELSWEILHLDRKRRDRSSWEYSLIEWWREALETENAINAEFARRDDLVRKAESLGPALRALLFGDQSPGEECKIVTERCQEEKI